MVEPRCPFCNAQGLDKIAAKNLGTVSLVYCGQCGAIYGVVPLLQKKETGSAPGADPVSYVQKPKPEWLPPHTPGDDTPKSETSPEEALSYWPPGTGEHGFYTRIARPGEDDEEEK